MSSEIGPKTPLTEEERQKILGPIEGMVSVTKALQNWVNKGGDEPLADILREQLESYGEISRDRFTNKTQALQGIISHVVAGDISEEEILRAAKIEKTQEKQEVKKSFWERLKKRS